MKRRWAICEETNCNEHKLVCSYCHFVADSYCEKHYDKSKMIKIGDEYYCRITKTVNSQVSKLITYHTGSLSKCYYSAKCEMCKKKSISADCRGPSNFHDDNCKKLRFSRQCSDCAKWTIGLDKIERCPDCHEIYKQKHTCVKCSSYTDTKFKCHVCENNFCEKCDKMTVIDISPTKLYGYGYDTYVCERRCKKCMKGHTVESVQDYYRRYC